MKLSDGAWARGSGLWATGGDSWSVFDQRAAPSSIHYRGTVPRPPVVHRPAGVLPRFPSRAVLVESRGTERTERSARIGSDGSGSRIRARWSPPEPTLHKTIGCHEVINDHAIVDPGATPSTCDRA